MKKVIGMPEHTVLSSFSSREKAKGAAKKIAALGVETIDIISGNLHTVRPVTSDVSGLQGMISDLNWGLTAVIPEPLVERVTRVIKDAGGYT